MEISKWRKKEIASLYICFTEWDKKTCLLLAVFVERQCFVNKVLFVFRISRWNWKLMEDITKTIMFTSPLQNGQNATIQYQTADGTILKTPKVEGQKAQDFPAFYTTSNVSFFTSLFQGLRLPSWVTGGKSLWDFFQRVGSNWSYYSVCNVLFKRMGLLLLFTLTSVKLEE